MLKNKDAISLIVCPTSLLYNWKEELAKFNPKLKALVVDGIPTQRKRLLANIGKYDVDHHLLHPAAKRYRDL